MKALLLTALIGLLVSCSPFGLNPMGYKVLHEDLDTAWKTVSSMQYQYDPDNYWKSPMEFFHDGGGDCEDFATALIYLLGKKAYMIITEDDSVRHAIVLYCGQYIDPQAYKVFYSRRELSIRSTWDYTEVLNYATSCGSKSL